MNPKHRRTLFKAGKAELRERLEGLDYYCTMIRFFTHITAQNEWNTKRIHPVEVIKHLDSITDYD